METKAPAIAELRAPFPTKAHPYMKYTFAFLSLILLHSCAPSTTTENTPSTTATTQNSLDFQKVYTGTIGKDLEVVFDLKSKSGVVSGVYFYKSQGIDIDLTGSAAGKELTLSEMDNSGVQTAALVLTREGTNLNGEWKDGTTGKPLPVSLTETNWIIPPIPDSVVGRYTSGEKTSCKLELNITKTGREYTYTLKTPTRNLKGRVTFFRDLRDQTVGVNLEGIRWTSNEGALNDGGNPKEANLALPNTLDWMMDGNSLLLQNGGNSMNAYTKLGECSDKYISLVKEE